MHTTSAVQTLHAHTVSIDSDLVFFTTPRLTSGRHASACAVSDRFLGRRPPALGLVARHLRSNLSDVVWTEVVVQWSWSCYAPLPC